MTCSRTIAHELTILGERPVGIEWTWDSEDGTAFRAVTDGTGDDCTSIEVRMTRGDETRRITILFDEADRDQVLRDMDREAREGGDLGCWEDGNGRAVCWEDAEPIEE